MIAHIAITPAARTVTVSAAGETVATSANALELREGSYPPVLYIPKHDIDMSRLARTATRSHCPHKGDASYWTVSTATGAVADAGWSSDAPFDAVAEIKDHIAFYPSKVRIETS